MEGVIFNPRIYVADLGNFLSMKMIQNGNLKKTLENKCCNRLGDCQCKSSSEEVDISLEEREEKTADVSDSDIFESQSLLSVQEN